jgi:ligand-binding sensor domain-containing protein
MAINAILFFCLLPVINSCTGQNTSKITDNTFSDSISFKKELSIAIGDTVIELDKRIWIVFQDKYNYDWFGSNGQGVYRYDGKTILHFTTKDGLLNDSIRGIQGDKSGNIFITSMDGISKFDGQKFTTLPIIESNEWKLDSNDLWFSILGKRGDEGPYRYDGKLLHRLKFPKHYMEEAFYEENGKHPWSPYEVYTIYKDSKGNIWFGTAALGVCRYDGKTLSWLYEKELTLTPEGGSFGIRSIIEDKVGKFWFSNTAYRYNIFPFSSNEQDKTLINYKREKGIENLVALDGKDIIYFMSVIEDNKGDMWMATYGQGVWQFDGKNITHYPIKDGSQDVTLFSIYKDKHEGIWLGTHEAGAYKFNGESFEKFVP